MTQPSHLSQAVASFQRCRQTGRFIERFYDRLIAFSPEVAGKFRDTDLARQRQMLEESLHTLLAAGEIPPSGPIRGHLERVARRHGRVDLDIRPELYDAWLDCLIQTVAESDPEYTAEIAEHWRRALRPGIDFMRIHY